MTYIPRNQIVVVFLLVLLSMTSCSENNRNKGDEKQEIEKPDYLSLEKERLDSMLSHSEELNTYLKYKTIIRAIGSDNVPDKLNADMYKTAGKYVYRIAMDDYPTASQVLQDLPTLMKLQTLFSEPLGDLNLENENAYTPLVNSIANLADYDGVPPSWKKEYESLLIAISLDQLGFSDTIAMYELNGLELSNIDDNELRLISSMLKSSQMMLHDFPYLAVEELGASKQYLASVNELSGTFSHSWAMHKNDSISDEEIKSRVEGLILLMEGMAYISMPDKDMKSKAKESLLAYHEIASKHTKLDEWNILAEIISQELKNNPEESIKLIDNYKNLENLSFSERSELRKAEKAQSKNDATNIQKVIIAGIIIQKLSVYVNQTNALEELKDNKLVDELLDLKPKLKEFESYVNGITNIL